MHLAIKLKKEMLSDKVKKNILDLEYNKCLLYQTTGIIVVITYLIGVAIGFTTGQIDYKNAKHIASLVFGSLAFVGLIGFLLRQYKKRLKEIPEEIKQLRL